MPGEGKKRRGEEAEGQRGEASETMRSRRLLHPARVLATAMPSLLVLVVCSGFSRHESVLFADGRETEGIELGAVHLPQPPTSLTTLRTGIRDRSAQYSHEGLQKCVRVLGEGRCLSLRGGAAKKQTQAGDAKQVKGAQSQPSKRPADNKSAKGVSPGKRSDGIAKQQLRTTDSARSAPKSKSRIGDTAKGSEKPKAKNKGPVKNKQENGSFKSQTGTMAKKQATNIDSDASNSEGSIESDESSSDESE
eukprot:749043-Hanusia_phi.AAC.3